MKQDTYYVIRGAGNQPIFNEQSKACNYALRRIRTAFKVVMVCGNTETVILTKE
jgi:hypothetical protein